MDADAPNTSEKNTFVKVKLTIPGSNTKSHEFITDEFNYCVLTVKDLITLLNKKIKGTYNLSYFEFYFDDKIVKKTHSQRINPHKRIKDFNESASLILVPKILTKHDNYNTVEAYKYEFVKLLNEKREYQCFKIRKYKSHKERLLIVDRWRIVKQRIPVDDADPFYTRSSVPIDIGSIEDICVNKINPRQFIIKYWHPHDPIKDDIRIQTYEFRHQQIPVEIQERMKKLTNLLTVGYIKRIEREYKSMIVPAGIIDFIYSYQIDVVNARNYNIEECKDLVKKVQYLQLLKQYNVY